MAWGSQGPVFLGEDLMHTQDYCDETARIIDEEVEKILREQEQRCRAILSANRNALDLVARGAARARDHRRCRGERLIELGRGGARPDDVTTRGADFQVVRAFEAALDDEPSPDETIVHEPGETQEIDEGASAGARARRS